MSKNLQKIRDKISKAREVAQEKALEFSQKDYETLIKYEQMAKDESERYANELQDYNLGNLKKWFRILWLLYLDV